MEARSRYLLVGSFVLVLTACLIAFTFWVAGLQVIETRPAYRIYFTGSVTGLKEGSPVRFRGIPVGKVWEVVVDPDNEERVRVTIYVDANVPVKTDSMATLEMKGLAGDSFVQISGGSRAAPRLTAAGGPDAGMADGGARDGRRESADAIPVIASRPSPLAELFESAPRMLDTLINVGDRLNSILSAENERLITEAVANLHAMSRTLVSAAGDLNQTMASVRTSTTHIEGLVLDLRRQSDLLTTSVDQTLAQVRGSLGDLNTSTRAGADELARTASEMRRLGESLGRLTDEASGFLAENREPMRDFTSVGLYELSRLIIELRHLTESLGRMTQEIERSPVHFLFSGAKDKEGKPGAQ